MRHTLLALVMVTALAIFAGPAAATISQPTRMKLHDKAIAAAKALKEPNPTRLRAVRTTWGKVKKAFGGGPTLPASTAVYVIAMNGRFKDSGGVHRHYNLVLKVRRLKAVVGYLDAPYPTQLGATTSI